MSKKERALKIIAELTNTIAQASDDEIGDLLMLVKVKGDYLRFSTKLDDSVVVIGFLETLKHDILKRASGG